MCFTPSIVSTVWSTGLIGDEMNAEQAREMLAEGASIADMMEAVAVLAETPGVDAHDLVAALSQIDCVAEQAAFALYRLTGRPLPTSAAQLSKDPGEWTAWLARRGSPNGGDPSEPLNTSRQTHVVRGTVKWFNDAKGFGFITAENGQQVFVHQSEIRAGGFRALAEGESVSFEIERGPKGPRATRVRRGE